MAKLIDIDQVLKENLKGKTIARPFVWILKKIIHQDWMNVLLKDIHSNDGVFFAGRTVDYLDVKIEVFGLEKLPDNKKYIFVSNHPLGGLDGVSLGYIIGSKYNKKVKFLINSLLMYIEPLRSIAIPISMNGHQQKQIAKAVNKAIDDGEQLILFPAGACSRFQPQFKGVHDLEWKKTFISLSQQSQRDVVPIHFEAKNSFVFYALAFIRKTLGIKTNVELLFLVHEMYKNKHNTFKVYFGNPIPYQTFDKRKSSKQWAEDVRKISYEKAIDEATKK